eukprot:6670908-Lingulodinium_polyedra.AAC.1
MVVGGRPHRRHRASSPPRSARSTASSRSSRTSMMPFPRGWSRSSAPVLARARIGRAQSAPARGTGLPCRRAADAA